MAPADWDTAARAVRELAPSALEALGYKTEAAELRKLRPITNKASALAAMIEMDPMLRHVRATTMREDVTALVIVEAAYGVASAAWVGNTEFVAWRAERLAQVATPILQGADMAPGRLTVVLFIVSHDCGICVEASDAEKAKEIARAMVTHRHALQEVAS